MARILCVTNGLPGLLYTSLEMARRLVTAGHEVTYCSYAETEPTVLAHDLPFVALDRGSYDTFLEADARASWPRRLVALTRRRRRALESLGLDGFLEHLRRSRPDLLLIDGELHEQIIVASGAGLNLALLNTFIAIWRRPGLPPAHHRVTPGVGWKGSRLGIALLWLELRLRKLRRAATLRLRHVGCDRLSLLRRLTRQERFDLRRETDASQWLIPFTYRRLPILSLHAREFEFPHSPPTNVSFVGPMVPEERADDRVTAETRTRLEALFERRRTSRNQTRLIYTGFGSFFSAHADLIRRLIAALGTRPDWDLVLSLAGSEPPEGLHDLPENVHLFSWVPQLKVLREADVAVVHGGVNTVDECVLAGVPMLIYCGNETDMAGTTERAVHHKLGVAGDREGDDPAMVCARLERLLTDVTIRQSLDRMQGAFALYRERRVLEHVVQSLVDREAPPE
jgi:UDP:flavonoid glycosyltransferase YjiC (YdhE family)